MSYKATQCAGCISANSRLVAADGVVTVHRVATVDGVVTVHRVVTVDGFERVVVSLRHL